ncbi:cytochrome c oxidase subunit 3 [Hymenobacter koreensis]|uniref:Heme-copper oxidase subunit III family profile domain-containing protein n=1 Tax=Hymenobacter koreensis TaxID=1084523 RepID=A0ABP8IVS3_9BACT
MHSSETLTNKQPGSGIHPLRFLMWLMIVSIIMMFAAFTSAYVVRRGEGNWLDYALPTGLLVNTVLIVASSASMQWAWFEARRDELKRLQIGLFLTVALGGAFLVGQWNVWGELVRNKIFFGGVDANPSGSFLYVLTGVHAFHLVTGLIFLLIVFLMSLRFQVHSRKMMTMTNAAIYWHFLGALWLYLYLFLLLNH